MKPHIDPKVDYVFKLLLGSEQHKNLLIHFLNAVFAKESDMRIQEVTLLNPFNERASQRDKLSIVDVKARDDSGRWYQIEIQVLNHAGLASRMLYMWSTIYHRQLKKGQDYAQLQPVIAIWILNEPLFKQDELSPHLSFVPWNIEHNLLLSKDMRFEILQLPTWSEDSAALNELDRWFYFFREGEEADTEDLPDFLQSEEMKEAVHVLQEISESDREYMIYLERLDAQFLEATKRREQEEATRKMQEAMHQTKIAEHKAETAEHRAETAEHRAETAEHRAETAEHKAETAEHRFKTAEHKAKILEQEKERLAALLREMGVDPE
ncbi:hypothetical protein CSA56_06210 [candidate division KSB3 bacterium]|uniref:Transposase n=1 Tax=candidate division KSB3 bacterium TaxID=2044937 RepID=A0A2G6KH19_9BACT|nr:MAG: hypothetical protein CSA56_06210 [candidate division KSB3 bacterium]